MKATERYSTLESALELVGYFFAHQGIRLGQKKIQNPNVEHRVFGQPAQFALG